MSLQHSPPSSPGPIACLASVRNKNNLSNDIFLKRNDLLDDFFGTPKNITVIGSKYSDDENVDDVDDEFFSDSGEILTSIATSTNLRSKKSLFFDNSSIHLEEQLYLTSKIPEATASDNSDIKTTDLQLEISSTINKNIGSDDGSEQIFQLQHNESLAQKIKDQAQHPNINQYKSENRTINENNKEQKKEIENCEKIETKILNEGENKNSNVEVPMKTNKSNLDAEKSFQTLTSTNTSNNYTIDKLLSSHLPETKDPVEVSFAATKDLLQDLASAINLNHFLMPSNSQNPSSTSISKLYSNSACTNNESSNKIIDKYIKMKKFLVSTSTSSSKNVINNMLDLPGNKSNSNSNTFKRKKTLPVSSKKPSSSTSSTLLNTYSNISRKSSKSSLAQQLEHLEPSKRKSTISLSRLNLDTKSSSEFADKDEIIIKTLTPSKSRESKKDIFLFHQSANDGFNPSLHLTKPSSSAPMKNSFSGLSTTSSNSLRKSKPFSSLRKRSDVFALRLRSGSVSNSPKKDSTEDDELLNQQIDVLEVDNFNQQVSHADLRNPRRKKSLSLETSSFLRKNIFTNRSYDTLYMQEIQNKYPKPLQTTHATATTHSDNHNFSPMSLKFFSESAPTTPASYKTNFGLKNSNLENSTSMSSFNTLAKSGISSLHKKKSIATISSSLDNLSINPKNDEYYSYRYIEDNSLNTDLDDLLNAD